MARRAPDLPPPDAVRALVDADGRIAVRVTPGARVESLAIEDGKLLARVRAKPKDGEANVAVLALLAKSLGVATSKLRLLRGATGRNKLVQLPPG